MEFVAKEHSGKWRPWFTNATWSLVTLTLQEFGGLVLLDSGWTKAANLIVEDGPNYRTLRRVAERAIASNYLALSSADKDRRYSRRLEEGMRLQGPDRITICSVEDDPPGDPQDRYQLLDGAGRSLPYMMLVLEERLRYEPVEAFKAGR